jgi:hypothetical protein
MAGEEKTGGAGGLGGEAKAAGGKRRLNVDLGEPGNERTALQSLFQGPGGVLGLAGLDNKKAGGVETGAQQAVPVRAPPFLSLGPRQAPQHGALRPGGFPGDHGKGKAQGG